MWKCNTVEILSQPRTEIKNKPCSERFAAQYKKSVTWVLETHWHS